MKKVKGLISTVVLGIFLLALGQIQAEAAELKFSVEPVVSDKQIDKKVNYFDILLEPKQEETLKVKLGNTTDKDVKVDIALNTAKTNGSGVVEYRPNELSNTKNLPLDISQIVEYPEQVTVPAKSEVEVSFKLKMMAKKFDGILAGGIQFRESNQEEQANKDGKDAVAINNTFSYVLAVLVRQNKNDITPNVILDKAYAETQYGRSNTILRLSNNATAYLNKMAIDADVFYEQEEKSIAGISKEDMQFAPNSVMNFKIGMGDEKLVAGNYNVKGFLYGDESSVGEYEYKDRKYRYRLEINESFNVSSEKAKELNDKNVKIEKDNTNILIACLIGLVILLIVLVLVFLWIIKKKKKVEDQVK